MFPATGDASGWPALTALFESDPAIEPLSLTGGQILFHQGDRADAIYLLTQGRLAAFHSLSGLPEQFDGIIAAGEVVGEMGLLAGVPRTASVIALRDSKLLQLPADRLALAAQASPQLMAEIAHLALNRLCATRPESRRGPGQVFCLMALTPATKARDVAGMLHGMLRSMGQACTVICHADGADALHHADASDQLVLACVEAGEEPWGHQCRRQADRLLLIGSGAVPAPEALAWPAGEPLVSRRLIDLIMLHDAARTPRGSAPWRARTGARRVFHLRAGVTGDLARLARILLGTAVGLVLSGGGARAYAHIGAIRALRQAGIAIDAAYGTSMGSIIGAGLASGWTDADMDDHIRAAFVASDPLNDRAFPLVALTRGHTVDRRLAEHLGEGDIEDLLLPFGCTSSDLTEGCPRLHTSGPLVGAVRAAISLPGVLPPVVDGEAVLVDGAVFSNFPADVARTLHKGPLIGLDVTRIRGLSAADLAAPGSFWQWLRQRGWRQGAPIVPLLMRSASVATEADLLRARACVDVFVAPDVTGTDIRDWTRYDACVAAGYAAMRASLDQPAAQFLLASPKPALA
jgi:NTE family protein